MHEGQAAQETGHAQDRWHARWYTRDMQHSRDRLHMRDRQHVRRNTRQAACKVIHEMACERHAVQETGSTCKTGSTNETWRWAGAVQGTL